MGFLVQEIRSFEAGAQLIEHSHKYDRPMLLKDFLRDVDGGCCRSSRSTKTKKLLLRSWSKRAAAAKKMSAVHKVIKLLHFSASSSSKSPPSSSSPVSLTKRRSDRIHEGNNDIFGGAALEVKVKVKDILRWRSFRDIVDDDPTPLDYLPTAATTATATSFKNNIPKPKGDWSFEEEEEEYEQQSPVSVLEYSPFRQVQESTSPYHPTLATLQREKRNINLTRRSEELREIGICNATEEKAKQLLRHLKAEDVEEEDDDSVILMDFFIDEISKLNDDCKILKIAKSWKDGEYDQDEFFVKDTYMERGGICWNDDFKQEQRELCRQLEITFFNDLIDHLVADYIDTSSSPSGISPRM